MDLDDVPPVPAPSLVRLKVLSEIDKMRGVQFNHSGHGELPIRPDSEAFLMSNVFDASHDDYWDHLTLEACGVLPAGVPWLQFLGKATGRRIMVQAPCWGVVGLIQHYPQARVQIQGEPQSPPQITSFTRVDSLSSPGWAKVKEYISWAKSALITS